MREECKTCHGSGERWIDYDRYICNTCHGPGKVALKDCQIKIGDKYGSCICYNYLRDDGIDYEKV